MLMKKIVAFVICLLFIFSLAACSGEEEAHPDRPPAFTVLQNQAKLKKHSESGESTSFSREEFHTFLGEELERITITSLPLPEAGTLIFNGAAVMEGQTLPADRLEYLKFIPAPECQSAAFVFTCDSAGYNGKELCCEITFGGEVNTAPIVTDSTLKTVEGISCGGALSITEPNGDAFTVNILTYPTNGFISVSKSGEVVYTPNDGFHGRDSMVFNVSDDYGLSSSNATLSINVQENTSGLYFADMQDNSYHLYAHRMCANDAMIYRKTNGEYYFDPEAKVTKADFLVMMMCVVGLDGDVTAVADSAVNDDENLSSGMKGYLSAAVEKELIKLDKGNFSPEAEITVGEAAYMITKGLSLPYVGSESASADSDGNIAISVMAAVKAGVLTDNDGSVDVNATLTKAETAKILCGIEDYMAANNMQK